MLRMRRFGKDRCGYDARDTGLRHNRSLPRCRNLRGPAWSGGTRSCATGCPPTWPGTRSTRAALGAWRCGVSPADPVGSWRRRPTFYKMWAGANHVYVKERPEVGRGCAKHLRNGRGVSFPVIGVSILLEKKGEGALMAQMPPVADTDGTDLALPLEVARRSGSICVGEAGAVIPSHTSR